MTRRSTLQTDARRPPSRLVAAPAVPLAMTLLAAGCVERTIKITSEPAGALVWVNDREIGRTPVDTDFVYYGTYDVRLELSGHEPLLTSGDAVAPWWDWAGPDLVSELLPVPLHHEVLWHYVLEPVDEDAEALLERARGLREQVLADQETASTPEDGG
ncbi:MAG: PEGA domain-containing protein [Planctomycetota bacterium]|jgi:hypothetical protein